MAVSGPGSGVVTVATFRRIGFRFLAYVTEDDSNPAAVTAKGEGTGSFTMRFRVSGINLYVRGANMIPMEVLKGLLRGCTRSACSERGRRELQHAAHLGRRDLSVQGVL